MTVRAKLRGWAIEFDEINQFWRYSDNQEETASHYRERPCGVCFEHSTPEGHDPCLGTLPGVLNACCGHGEVQDAYVMINNQQRVTLRGESALKFISILRTQI